MRIDVTHFNLFNVIDTCAIWNILSSSVLDLKADLSGCRFCMTQFVKYESLYKKRKKEKINDMELQKRLSSKFTQGKYQEYPITIEDLQDPIIINYRKRLSKGELSSMIFAKKTRQAFLTDDQGARKLSEEYIGLQNTQTVPHLFGWLVYCGEIIDSEKEEIIKQHASMDGLLGIHFERIYLHALEKRLIKNNA